MAQKILSVYIGENRIRVVEFTKGSKQNLIINRMADAATPPESIRDGLITDIDKVAERLRNCIDGMGTKAKSVIFTISSKKISGKEADIPYIKQKERINELLSVNPKDFFPMSNTDDYLYSHNLLQILQSENGGKQSRIMAVAVPRAIVEAYHTLAEKIGLHIEAIDYTGNSILQLMKKSLTAENNLLVQIENDISYVSIVINGVVVLQRSISYGLETAAAALADVRDITEEQAMHILQEEQQSITEKEYEDITFMLMNSIARFLDFYTSRSGALEIQAINIYSTNGCYLEIGGILQKAIGGTAVYVEELQGITFAKGFMPEYKQVFRYLSCIGAAIDPMGFRLVKEEEKENKDAKTKKKLYIALIVSGVIALLSVIGTSVFYFMTQKNKAELTAKIKEIESVRAIEAEYTRAQTEYNALLAFYETTQNDNEKLYDFILDLEEVMPESVGFTGLQANSGAISVSAQARGKEAVAELIIQLKALPYIDDVFVTNISETFDEFNVPTTTFAFTCIMKDIDAEETAGTEGADNEAE